nr:alcohol-forming fatty acyl-CoA reductase isoform X2 [Oryza sativa Japonica Group]
MDAATVAGYFKDKSILITGSTGFLGKIFVEKILRIQPDVKKIFLLVRAADTSSAEQRVLNEVIGNELFGPLRENYGSNFYSFMKEKISPLAGDIINENLGLESLEILKLSKEIDIIVNGAATTNFYERYDVSLASNVLGAKYVCKFAKKCANLKMFLHISTAFVSGEQEGLLLEKVFQIGETLKEGCHLDIAAELQLVESVKAELTHSTNGKSEQTEKITMKKLGLKRARQFGWPNTYVFTKAMGEMLVGHFGRELPVVIIRPSIVSSIYHDPLPGWIEGTRTIDSIISAYAKQTIPHFIGAGHVILDVVLHLVNPLLGGYFSQYYNKSIRSYRYFVLLAKLYMPYAFFNACFNGTNLARLQTATTQDQSKEACVLNFDPKSIDWEYYLYNSHIPGVMKYAHKK